MEKRKMPELPAPPDAAEKMANLLALLLTREMPTPQAIVTLTRAGFSTTDVCALLNTTSVNVRQANFQARRRGKRTRTSVAR